MNNKLLTVLCFFLIAHLALIVLFPLFQKDPVVVIEKSFDSFEVESEKKSFEKSLKPLQKKEKELSQKLIETDTLLKDHSTELLALKNAIKRSLSDSIWEATKPEEKIILCDSLKEKVVKLLVNQDLSDNIQQEIIAIYKALTENQKSQIRLLNKHNKNLSEHLVSCSVDSEKLEKELKKQERKNKRSAFFNKVSGTAAVALTVVTAILISAKK